MRTEPRPSGRSRALRLWPFAARRAALALACGALSALAFAPWGWTFVLWIACPVLLLLLRGPARPWSDFGLGWAFGFGQFAVSLNWIGEAFLIDAARFSALAPLGMVLLPAVLALFCGTAAGLACAIVRPGALRLPALAAMWTLMEALRGHLATGFPWNQTAYAWDSLLPVLQASSLLGALGLGFATWLMAGAPALIFIARSRRAGFAAALAGLVALAALWGFGGWRLSQPDPGDQPGVRLRLVQPNIPQAEKWRRERRAENFLRHLRLSAAPATAGAAPSHIVWPETAAAFVLAAEPQARARIGALAPPGGAVITGTVRRAGRARADLRIWNSLGAVTAGGEIVAGYDKAHLVPFGEYLPWRALLAGLGLDALAVGALDYSAGPGPVVLDLPGLPPVQPLICYEAIFPHLIAAAGRPAWLLNLTNDAWFGSGAGPRQHLAMARMRAIEQGLPLVRSASTGISAVFDAFGRERARLGIERAGILDSPLPRPLVAPTVYARIGDVPIVAVLLILVLSIGLWSRRFTESDLLDT